MRNRNDLPKATFESAWALIQENAQGFKEMREDRKKFSEFMERMERQADNDRKKIDDSIKAMHKELGGIGHSNGEVAESYFINSFEQSMQFAGQEYDGIFHNHKEKRKKINLQGEYDLVLYNCTSAVIIEIKYKARIDDVAQLLKQAAVFKQFFPQYANYDIYLGLAAFHFEEGTETESISQGIAVIKQVGENMVINDENLKTF